MPNHRLEASLLHLCLTSKPRTRLICFDLFQIQIVENDDSFRFHFIDVFLRGIGGNPSAQILDHDDLVTGCDRIECGGPYAIIRGNTLDHHFIDLLLFKKFVHVGLFPTVVVETRITVIL